MNHERGADLVRTTLQLLLVAALIAGTFWILRPFLVPLLWATTIVVATWPAFLRLQALLGGRRGLAALVMSAVLLLVLLVPLYVAISTIARNADRVVEWSSAVAALPAATPPEWLDGVPLVGDDLAARWRDAAATPPDELARQVAPYARLAIGWFLGHVGGAGRMALEFLLTVIVAALLYANGDDVGRAARAFARRVSGRAGEDAVRLAAQAVRAVALGVVATAAIQSAFGGIGLAVAGVPLAGVLTALMFVLGVAQLGPVPVLVPAVAWAYWRIGPGWGTALLVWSVLVAVLDNFLKPILIRRGADLPLLLIFAGVLGGLIAFGVIGLFVGPTVLAVAYTLLVEWVADEQAPE